MLDKLKIARNFSRYAHLYDRYADFEIEIAWELLGQIQTGRFFNILELGCGTGNYTLLLRQHFKQARIKAVDISAQMIEVASQKLKGKNIRFIVSDAETLNLSEAFDLITSSACLQWFVDLEKALYYYKKAIRKEGAFFFSIFGPATFCELGISLEEVVSGCNISASYFLTKEKLGQILKNNFKEASIREVNYTEVFQSLKDLLNKIKYSGSRGYGLGGRVYLGKGRLKRLEEVYLAKFGKIKATYQVFFCQGKGQ